MEEIDVAMVIAQEENGNFLAMKKNLEYTDKERYRKNPWETAGGKIKEKEKVTGAAVREVGEETNITGVYTGPEEYPRNKYRTEHIQIDEEGEKLKINFYAVAVGVPEEKPNLVLSKEHSDYDWLSKEQFEENLPEHNVEGFNKVLEVFE
jgi:8-oxo-dGTP pyrophosphatase MutT (NUDIX family)